MAKNIWLISDTHFCHENIIQYCGRPFANAELMNEQLIDNWNSVVKPGDKVYHLGDFALGPNYKEELPRLMPKLNGRKRLIVGNHDEIKYLASGSWFDKISMWKVFTEWSMLLTHVPVHESSIHERIVVAGGANVHGHIHNQASPAGPYYNVSVENINYTPVHIEDVRATLQNKT
jgi:calcineurin-like phosphoesterase family protein